ncbi:hypothetical protein T484DRAFT_1760522, partial [Baffinella frigidus]
MLIKNKNLEDMDLSRTKIDGFNFEKTQRSLKDMDLSRNKIRSDGVDALMKSLWSNRALTALNLRLNAVCDKGGISVGAGGISVGAALSHNSTLCTLDLMGCDLGDSGCVPIFNALGAAKHKALMSDNVATRR